ncbi:alpha/beta hydrolase family protein [Thalassospira marina]|uniref:Alpha/beta hydrolase n=1 Tax=Thalassospira marina TaxID=2048283 RepID=A0A2N3KEV5_9PROT|nr:alpha/beta fold hydrolase [Thalassospira marina]PKR49054.1 alpha/beta hydrolase [Thalassospira marina]
MTDKTDPVRFITRTSDGIDISGFEWRPETRDGDGAGSRPVVIICAATAVRCRYYARFARYLCQHGFDVLTFDYRGIGESRPKKLRGFRAGWGEWGLFDVEAILQYAQARFPGQPLYAVGHSIGGFALGLAPSSHLLKHVVTVGAQFAYWRDYALQSRRRMFMKWHIFMPVLARSVGYFPGARLGWLEDVPRHVVHDWSRMGPRAENSLSLPLAANRLQQHFAAMQAQLLAIGLNDDPFGTVAAVERLLSYYTGSNRTHLRIAPDDIGVEDIGHFAFFHNRFENSLWPIALGWLQNGTLPDNAPGMVRTPDQEQNHG